MKDIEESLQVRVLQDTLRVHVSREVLKSWPGVFSGRGGVQSVHPKPAAPRRAHWLSNPTAGT